MSTKKRDFRLIKKCWKRWVAPRTQYRGYVVRLEVEEGCEDAQLSLSREKSGRHEKQEEDPCRDASA